MSRAKGYKCYNSICRSCVGTFCNEPGDNALYCAGRSVNCRTNAGRIRGMSDEELASFLCDFLTSCEPEHPCNDCVAKSYCHTGHNGMIDWLQQPAEEE